MLDLGDPDPPVFDERHEIKAQCAYIRADGKRCRRQVVDRGRTTGAKDDGFDWNKPHRKHCWQHHKDNYQDVGYKPNITLRTSTRDFAAEKAALQSGHIKKKGTVMTGTERAEKQGEFLAAFAQIGTVSGASKAVKISRQTHYDWLASEEDYPSRFADAQDQATDALESEARRRAIVGVDEPVYYQGEIVGYTRRKSDVLLIFMLKGAKPEKYSERLQHSGPGGGPMQVEGDGMSSKEFLLRAQALYEGAQQFMESGDTGNGRGRV
jgi:hypothetical protein